VSTKDRPDREALADRMEDVEAQRDALHQALRYLLMRQEQQARDYEKRLKIKELELARAQELGSPRRLGYEREVRNLREEVNHLRQRAEDALEQKWQCEKGLAGLKMDLDRAEQETTSLRVLLQEHDIAVPDGLESERDGFAEVIATSSSLEMAYKQLQAEREVIEASAAHSPLVESDAFAASISRTEALANHVQQQLQRNNSLRNRLAEAIGKGEKDQQLSAARINELQARLKELEETLLMAQQHSEEEMARHEEEICNLEASHNAQLMRVKNGSRSPAALSPKPPSSPFVARSPRLDKTTSGEGIPLNQAIQAETLEKRVKELEKLLRDADTEMEEVVSRMNRAQIEVAELQSDRYVPLAIGANTR
jgi:chromosome segregation ATPase